MDETDDTDVDLNRDIEKKIQMKTLADAAYKADQEAKQIAHKTFCAKHSEVLYNVAEKQRFTEEKRKEAEQKWKDAKQIEMRDKEEIKRMKEELRKQESMIAHRELLLSQLTSLFMLASTSHTRNLPILYQASTTSNVTSDGVPSSFGRIICAACHTAAFPYNDEGMLMLESHKIHVCIGGNFPVQCSSQDD